MLEYTRIYSIFPCQAGAEVLRARRAGAQTTLIGAGDVWGLRVLVYSTIQLEYNPRKLKYKRTVCTLIMNVIVDEILFRY
jgi:hypothetical protein